MIGQYLHRRDTQRLERDTMVVDDEKLAEESVQVEVKL